MYELNTRKLGNYLRKAENLAPEVSDFAGLPESVDKKSFELFYRVMCAKTPSEIEDISLEQVIALYALIPEYSEFFEAKENPLVNARENLLHAKSVLKRRVL